RNGRHRQTTRPAIDRVYHDPRTLLRALPCGDPVAELTPPADASQLGVKEARLGRGTWRGEGRHRRRGRRIELCQDALEAFRANRQRVAITVNRAMHKAHDFGVFFWR